MKKNLFEMCAHFDEGWSADNKDKPSQNISKEIKTPQSHQLHLAKEKMLNTHYQNVVSLPMSGEEETSNAGEQLVRNNLADWNGLGENIPPNFQEIIPRIYVSQNPSQS